MFHPPRFSWNKGSHSSATLLGAQVVWGRVYMFFSLRWKGKSAPGSILMLWLQIKIVNALIPKVTTASIWTHESQTLRKNFTQEPGNSAFVTFLVSREWVKTWPETQRWNSWPSQRSGDFQGSRLEKTQHLLRFDIWTPKTYRKYPKIPSRSLT